MKKNHKDYVKNQLKNYSAEDVIITNHARIRMIQRQIAEKEVIENIINPKTFIPQVFDQW